MCTNTIDDSIYMDIIGSILYIGIKNDNDNVLLVSKEIYESFKNETTLVKRYNEELKILKKRYDNTKVTFLNMVLIEKVNISYIISLLEKENNLDKLIDLKMNLENTIKFTRKDRFYHYCKDILGYIISKLDSPNVSLMELYSSVDRKLEDDFCRYGEGRSCEYKELYYNRTKHRLDHPVTDRRLFDTKIVNDVHMGYVKYKWNLMGKKIDYSSIPRYESRYDF